ncbi:MAG: hypothetical protein V1932_01335 [Chloroflexota bacterium]
MFKLKLIFILSLIILAGMFISVMYLVPSNQQPPESKRVQIIKGENGWILQYDITNDKEIDVKYTIIVTVDNAARKDSAVVQAGKTYTYIYHVSPQQLDKGEVTLTLYEGDKTEPVEETTYYIGND